MKSGVIIDQEPTAPRQISSAPSLISGGWHAVRRWDRAVERWLGTRVNLIGCFVTAAGLLVRVDVAVRSYLNPDEALHYLIINQRSALWAYRVSLTNAHPPLIYLIVYFWHFLGRSELMLRFPSLIAGTAVCWAGWKWIETLFGRAAGMLSLIVMAFSPAAIALSAELRAYALLLFCEVAALYYLEIALQERSVRKMWYFSTFLYLAILTHYSAVFFILGTGVYACVRLVSSKTQRNLFTAWAGGQAGALAIYIFLYVTHISKLNRLMLTWVTSFDQAYSHSDRQHILQFSAERTLDIFTFIFQNRYVAEVLLVLWFSAAAFLIAQIFRRRMLRSRYVGIILLLPLLAVWIVGMAGFYPYVGSRHTAFLLPFVIATLSVSLAAIGRQRIWAAIVIATLLSAASNTSGKTPDTFIAKENQNRTLMSAAMTHIRQNIPRGGNILSDYQSALTLLYYLCGPELILPVGTFNRPASRVKCNGYTIGSFQTWTLQPDFFLAHFEEMVRAQRLSPGDKVWIFEAGWDPVLGRDLMFSSSKLRCVAPERFGANIDVIPLVVDQAWLPAAPLVNCLPAASTAFPN